MVNAILRGPDVGPALPGPLPGGEATPLGWDHWIVQSPNYRPNLQYVFAEEHFEQIALAPKSFRDFDFETRAMQLPAVAGQRLDLPLGPFQQRGGKLLLWHGYNDPVLSPLGSIDLFEVRATDEIGPMTRDDFLRLFQELRAYEGPRGATRSGKIMRRVLKARALGMDKGDLTTLEE